MGKALDFFGNKLAQFVGRYTNGYDNNNVYGRRYVHDQYFDGEKNAGELGIVTNLVIDFETMRARSWQAYTTSQLAQTLINASLLWSVGTGLRFKYEPNRKILEQNGINLDYEQVTELIDCLFNANLDSKRGTTSRMKTVHQLVYDIHKHAKVGGDCLVILDSGRENETKHATVRYVDGRNVCSPMLEAYEKRNIFDGIEINEYGEHVAFWVRIDAMNVQRIPAYNEFGTLQAFMYYGNEYRIGTYRGMPFLYVILETIAKLDRYTEATVGAAEEVAKIPIVVEHNQHSTGQDVFKNVSGLSGRGDVNNDDSINLMLANTASKIKLTTGKQVVNGVVGATIKSLQNNAVIDFDKFFKANFEIACSVEGMPPEVVMNKYDTSFIASQGARGNWEFKLNYEREQIDLNLYQKIFNFWLEIECLKDPNLIKGYVSNRIKDNYVVIEAMQKCRFIGQKIPFLDKIKEIKAARMTLGAKFDNTPLRTVEDVTDDLGGGNFNTYIAQASKELDEVEKQGFKNEKTQQNNDNSTAL